MRIPPVFKRLAFFAASVMVLNLASPVHAFPSYANGGFRGALLMTEAERAAHTQKLQSMQKYDECRAYMDAHNQEIDRRAQAAGVQLPLVKGNPCDVMRGFGRIR